MSWRGGGTRRLTFVLTLPARGGNVAAKLLQTLYNPCSPTKRATGRDRLLHASPPPPPPAGAHRLLNEERSVDAPDPVLRDDDRGSGLDRYSGPIEHDIVPRLLHATRAGPLPPRLLFELGAHLAERRVAEFVGLIRGGDDGAGTRYVDGLLED